MDCSTPGFSVLHHLPELARTQVHWISDANQPSQSNCSFHFQSGLQSLWPAGQRGACISSTGFFKTETRDFQKLLWSLSAALCQLSQEREFWPGPVTFFALLHPAVALWALVGHPLSLNASAILSLAAAPLCPSWSVFWWLWQRGEQVVIWFFHHPLSWKLTCWNLILLWHPTSNFCPSLCLRFSYKSRIQRTVSVSPDKLL